MNYIWKCVGKSRLDRQYKKKDAFMSTNILYFLKFSTQNETATAYRLSYFAYTRVTFIVFTAISTILAERLTVHVYNYK
jgi:hypothetical protein